MSFPRVFLKKKARKEPKKLRTRVQIPVAAFFVFEVSNAFLLWVKMIDLKEVRLFHYYFLCGTIRLS